MFVGQIEGMLCDFFYNKRVVVIGGAQYDVKDTEADIVVFINDHWKPGVPVDMVFTGVVCKPHPALKDHRLKWLIMESTAQPEWHDIPVDAAISFCGRAHAIPCHEGIENVEFQVLSHLLGTKPFTGMQCINWIRKYPFESLRITGMNFYSRDGRTPYKVGPHLIDVQRKWLWSVVSTDPRIDVDGKLRGIIEEPRVPVCLVRPTEKEGDVIWSVAEAPELPEYGPHRRVQVV